MKKFMPILALILAVCDVGAQTPDTVSVNVFCYDEGVSSPLTIISEISTGTYQASFSNQMEGTNDPALMDGTLSFTDEYIHSNLISTPLAPIYLYELDLNLEYDLIYVVNLDISPRPRICLVTTDNLSGSKEIIIDESYLSEADSVVLERQVISGWEVIDDDVSTASVLDESYPSGQALTYRLRSAYDCESDEHTTILLSVTLDPTTNDANLSWTEYVGNVDDDIDGYYVLRESGPNVDTVATVVGTNLTGVAWTAGDKFRIEAYKESCNINPLGRMSLLSISSNTLDPSTVGISEEELRASIRMVNPSHELNLTLPSKMDVDVFTLSGQRVHTYLNTEYVNDNTYQSGMYLVVIHDDKTRLTQRLMITH